MPVAPRRSIAHRTAQPSIELLLDREVCVLDQILSEVRSGFRNQTHFDDLEERTNAMAQRIMAAFRGRR